MKKIVVVQSPKDWSLNIDQVEVVSAKAYLTQPEFATLKNTQVFNLCKDYRYQSTGYYVSLLAEARNHRVIPSVTTIQDFKSRSISRGLSGEIDELIQSSLSRLKSEEFTLSIYFGRNLAKQYDRLSRALYNLFQTPILKATFVHDKKWFLNTIQPLSIAAIQDDHWPFFKEAAEQYFAKNRYGIGKKQNYKYDLAILVNPEEKSPPSDKKALSKFKDAAEKQGFWVDFIQKDDFSHLAEYDALFIRETTSVHHHTYRFARRAHAEGMVVIDDPQSILRCTNKVYLAELLNRAKIPIPETMTVHKDNQHLVAAKLGLPLVLKKPDSSFSQGVSKVSSELELKNELEKLFVHSDLIIAQKFIPTDYDWRIGVLNGEALYACRYFMAKNHWQIYNWEGSKKDQTGEFDCVPLDLVPKRVLSAALKSSALIGKGLYGVDVKEIKGHAYVIEVNDNPSLDQGVEDLLLGDLLYHKIIGHIKSRLMAEG